MSPYPGSKDILTNPWLHHRHSRPRRGTSVIIPERHVERHVFEFFSRLGRLNTKPPAVCVPTTPFGHHHFPTHGVQSYDMVVQQTPQWQSTCYVGNLTPYTTQNDLVPLFQNYGYETIRLLANLLTEIPIQLQ